MRTSAWEGCTMQRSSSTLYNHLRSGFLFSFNVLLFCFEKRGNWRTAKDGIEM